MVDPDRYLVLGRLLEPLSKREMLSILYRLSAELIDPNSSTLGLMTAFNEFEVFIAKSIKLGDNITLDILSENLEQVFTTYMEENKLQLNKVMEDPAYILGIMATLRKICLCGSNAIKDKVAETATT